MKAVMIAGTAIVLFAAAAFWIYSRWVWNHYFQLVRRRGCA
jgi:hypothetical protein